MDGSYRTLYEEVVLRAWGESGQREDPLGLGSATTMGSLDNELSGERGINAKLGLSAALRKVATDNQNKEEIYFPILDLCYRAWNAKVYNDLCIVLDEAKKIFNKIGIILL